MKFKNLFGLRKEEGGVKGSRVNTRLDIAFVSMSGRKMCFIFFFQAGTFDFSPVNSAPVHCSRVPQTSHILVTFSLKMGSTVLFTHLKIILLQYFSVFNYIQMDS